VIRSSAAQHTLGSWSGLFCRRPARRDHRDHLSHAVIAGGADSPLPQDGLLRLAETIPDHRLVTIEAGHVVHETRPADFIAALRDFL
jgi:pimeloyl-ACP methyl ester carboxylesterase